MSELKNLNRFFARQLLVEKIEQMYLGKKFKELQKIEKIRRQKKENT